MQKDNKISIDDIKVGDKVVFNCFDSSTIDVTVTGFDNCNVIGISDKNISHWCPITDVRKSATGDESTNLPMWELAPLSDIAPNKTPHITSDNYLEVDGYRISIDELRTKLPYKK